MDLAEEADLSSSESENEIDIPIRVRPEIKIPEEFSVDNLLKERVNNPIIPRSYSFKENPMDDAENTQKTENTVSRLFSQMNIAKVDSRDGCIFGQAKSKFPFLIFKTIDIDEEKEESLFLSNANQIPSYMIKCIQNYPSQFPASPDFFLAYSYYIASNNILDTNLVLLKYSQLLPEYSINYKLWLNCLIYSIKHSLNAVFSLFSVCNFYLFKFESQEQADNARIEIFLLFFAMICTTDIIEHKQFSLILHQIRSCFIKTDFDSSQINYIVKIMCDMFFKIPIEMISSIASYYPVDGIGAILLHNFSIKIIFRFFDIEITEDDKSLNIESLSNEIYRVHILCNSDDNEDLKKASAVIALTERALVSALRFTVVPNEIIMKIIKSLQFTIKKSSIGLLTLLKEQIHFTRSQLEMFSHNAFKPSDPSDLFFES